MANVKAMPPGTVVLCALLNTAFISFANARSSIFRVPFPSGSHSPVLAIPQTLYCADLKNPTDTKFGKMVTKRQYFFA